MTTLLQVRAMISFRTTDKRQLISSVLYGALFSTALIGASSSDAQGIQDVFKESPKSGLLTTDESNSISYSCDRVGDAELKCSFIQTAVLFKATYSQLPDAIIEARKRYRGEKAPSAEQCTMFRDILAVLEGKKPARKLESALSAVEKADHVLMARAFGNYCDKPTEENFLAITRLSQNRDRRTCVVVANNWTHTFNTTDETKGRVWVVKSSPPQGPCGVVQLSRFESEQTSMGGSTFKTWKYIARKAITNPLGETHGLGKCGDIVDERTYDYSWRKEKQLQMSCDYIEFTYSAPEIK